jgi:hypothetical protein
MNLAPRIFQVCIHDAQCFVMSTRCVLIVSVPYFAFCCGPNTVAMFSPHFAQLGPGIKPFAEVDNFTANASCGGLQWPIDPLSTWCMTVPVAHIVGTQSLLHLIGRKCSVGSVVGEYDVF